MKVVVSSEGNYRYSNCLFVEVFDYFLKCSNEILDFLTSNSSSSSVIAEASLRQLPCICSSSRLDRSWPAVPAIGEF